MWGSRYLHGIIFWCCAFPSYVAERYIRISIGSATSPIRMQKEGPNHEARQDVGRNGPVKHCCVPKVEPEIIQIQIKEEPPESEDRPNPMGSANGEIFQQVNTESENTNPLYTARNDTKSMARAVTWLHDEGSRDPEANRLWLRHKSLADMTDGSEILDTATGPLPGALPGLIQHKAPTNAESESDTSKEEGTASAEVLGYICGKCGKCFSVTSDLITHHCSLNWNEDPAISHKQPELKNFNCKFCGKFCSTKYALQIHEFVHTGEKPYQCSECGKCFAQRSNLNSHRKTHTGVKPFKCTECGRHFLKKSNLQSHQKLHGENPFTCPECGAGFSTKSSLKKHKQTHTESA
ncbi:zinc finger protein 665 [Xenopus laevis]|uniref:Zinc finger protein 665 n=2 Tax=Xenopus laevis TaxID=8355 RepID=A0A8J0VL06_XENLA|nr:zinc finger protein 665 [Xenopus laevis]